MEHSSGVGCVHCTPILTLLNFVQLYRDGTLWWGWLCTLYSNINFIKLCTIVPGWNTLVGLFVYTTLLLTILNCVQLYRDETLWWGWLCTLYSNINYIKLWSIVQGWNTLVGLVVYTVF